MGHRDTGQQTIHMRYKDMLGILRQLLRNTELYSYILTNLYVSLSMRACIRGIQDWLAIRESWAEILAFHSDIRSRSASLALNSSHSTVHKPLSLSWVTGFKLCKRHRIRTIPHRNLPHRQEDDLMTKTTQQRHTHSEARDQQRESNTMFDIQQSSANMEHRASKHRTMDIRHKKT